MVLVKKVTFSEYLPWFWSEAASRGLRKIGLVRLCGLPKQRSSDLGDGENGTVNFTAHYFVKFMEALRVSIDYVEKKSGRLLSDAQREELSRTAWFSQNTTLLDKLRKDKKLYKKVVELAKKEQE